MSVIGLNVWGDSMFLGHKLAELRLSKQWSQMDAERKTGVRQSIINDLESGKTKNPRESTVARLAKGFRVSPDYFYYKTITVDALPDFPDDIRLFVMTEGNVEYLAVALKAYRAGVAPAALEKMIELLAEQPKKKQ
jgi:transcriptional regulator with XRE-family HTH domain